MLCVVGYPRLSNYFGAGGPPARHVYYYTPAELVRWVVICGPLSPWLPSVPSPLSLSHSLSHSHFRSFHTSEVSPEGSFGVWLKTLPARSRGGKHNRREHHGRQGLARIKDFRSVWSLSLRAVFHCLHQHEDPRAHIRTRYPRLGIADASGRYTVPTPNVRGSLCQRWRRHTCHPGGGSQVFLERGNQV